MDLPYQTIWKYYLPKETYEEKHKQITNQRAELEQTAERYKNIDADMKKRVVQVMALACDGPL